MVSFICSFSIINCVSITCCVSIIGAELNESCCPFYLCLIVKFSSVAQ